MGGSPAANMSFRLLCYPSSLRCCSNTPTLRSSSTSTTDSGHRGRPLRRRRASGRHHRQGHDRVADRACGTLARLKAASTESCRDGKARPHQEVGCYFPAGRVARCRARASRVRFAASASTRSASTWASWRNWLAVRPTFMLMPMCDLQLGLGARQRRQHAHRGQLTALPVEVVALEDVAEQMRLEVLVDGRCEIEQRTLDRRARPAWSGWPFRRLAARRPWGWGGWAHGPAHPGCPAACVPPAPSSTRPAH